MVSSSGEFYKLLSIILFEWEVGLYSSHSMIYELHMSVRSQLELIKKLGANNGPNSRLNERESTIAILSTTISS